MPVNFNDKALTLDFVIRDKIASAHAYSIDLSKALDNYLDNQGKDEWSSVSATNEKLESALDELQLYRDLFTQPEPSRSSKC